MEALILTGKEKLEFGERELAVPEDHEIAVRVAAAAICRTDAKMWRAGHRDLVMPRVLGHEVCGAIDEAPGRLFAVWPGSACGSCSMCRSGRENLCPEMKITGFHRDGGFAGQLIAPRSSLVEVPKGVGASLAVLAEPFACAIHGVKQSSIRRADRVLIYGAGTLGILLAVAAINRGASVAMIDTNAEKLARSAAFRNRYTIDADKPDAQEKFEIVLNATASADTLESGIRRLAPGGRFCLFSGLGGVPESPATIFSELHYRELELVGSYGCTRQDMRDALGLLSRYGHDLGFLVERAIRLDEAPAVMETVLAGTGFRQVIEFSDK
ncbi:alcohol dehydrogenase [Chlorobaculum sp. 24CR]|uniref:zinc-dependent alcohol dehydrogenase n=1 Tax=Chlorobaculum sp. 24CR TaxID=2508878 RepID=UPI00100B460D|nr:alcohol dehydrogenase catalytic domain-containing protein [Chlorobaculum sp. 24CR]RXK87834.1 alcohol dehydrogenase [Chlorobaculum sp. 24CR]